MPVALFNATNNKPTDILLGKAMRRSVINPYNQLIKLINDEKPRHKIPRQALSLLSKISNYVLHLGCGVRG
jgi:hypothetical protein